MGTALIDTSAPPFIDGLWLGGGTLVKDKSNPRKSFKLLFPKPSSGTAVDVRAGIRGKLVERDSSREFVAPNFIP